MFDIGWSELLVIAVVAIVVVGPKELPRMMRTFGHYAGKLRLAARDFQRQFDEAMRETEADEVRKAIESVRASTPSFDLKAPIDKPMMLPKEAPASPPPVAPAPAAQATPSAPPAPVAPVAPAPSQAAAMAASSAVAAPVEPPVKPARPKRKPALKAAPPNRASGSGGKTKTASKEGSGTRRRKAETEPGP